MTKILFLNKVKVMIVEAIKNKLRDTNLRYKKFIDSDGLR